MVHTGGGAYHLVHMGGGGVTHGAHGGRGVALGAHGRRCKTWCTQGGGGGRLQYLCALCMWLTSTSVFQTLDMPSHALAVGRYNYQVFCLKWKESYMLQCVHCFSVP